MGDFKGFVEKSKYHKMMSNIGQYRKIGSTKGVQKYDINCLLEQYYKGVLCECNMPLNFCFILLTSKLGCDMFYLPSLLVMLKKGTIL